MMIELLSKLRFHKRYILSLFLILSINIGGPTFLLAKSSQAQNDYSQPRKLENGVYSYGTKSLDSKYDASNIKFTKYRLKDGAEFLSFYYLDKTPDGKSEQILQGVVRGICTQSNDDGIKSSFLLYEVLDPNAISQGLRLCRINGDYADYIRNFAKQKENEGLIILLPPKRFENIALDQSPYIKNEVNNIKNLVTGDAIYVDPSKYWERQIKNQTSKSPNNTISQTSTPSQKSTTSTNNTSTSTTSSNQTSVKNDVKVNLSNLKINELPSNLLIISYDLNAEGAKTLKRAIQIWDMNKNEFIRKKDNSSDPYLFYQNFGGFTNGKLETQYLYSSQLPAASAENPFKFYVYLIISYPSGGKFLEAKRERLGPFMWDGKNIKMTN